MGAFFMSHRTTSTGIPLPQALPHETNPPNFVF